MRLFLRNHPLIMPLSDLTKSAGMWFDEIAAVLREDVDEFNAQVSGAPSIQAHGVLEISLDVKRDEEFHAPFSLKLSTRFSAIGVIANDPPGWLFLQVSKKSPIFDGVLYKGAIQVVQVPPASSRKFHTTAVNCKWLGKQPSTPNEVADLLWKQLLDPQVAPQFDAAAKAGH